MTSLYIDTIIRIKNGYHAKKEVVEVKYSRINEKIVSLLKTEGYVKEYYIEQPSDKKQKTSTISVELLYHQNSPSLSGVKIVSSPGQRIYMPLKDLKPVLNGLGRALISTSKGVLTDRDAKKQGVGGEVLCYIW